VGIIYLVNLRRLYDQSKKNLTKFIIFNPNSTKCFMIFVIIDNDFYHFKKQCPQTIFGNVDVLCKEKKIKF